MIPGLNSNLKHEDRIFHIQTEDSGSKYGHVISHLFYEGAILATVKKSYKDLLDANGGEVPTDDVLKLMRASHRQMVRKLISGDFNEAAGITTAPELAEPSTDKASVEETLQQAEAEQDANSKAVSAAQDETTDREQTEDTNTAAIAQGQETDIKLTDSSDVEPRITLAQEGLELAETHEDNSVPLAEVLNLNQTKETATLEPEEPTIVLVPSQDDPPGVDELAERLDRAARPVGEYRNAKELITALLD